MEHSNTAVSQQVNLVVIFAGSWSSDFKLLASQLQRNRKVPRKIQQVSVICGLTHWHHCAYLY